MPYSHDQLDSRAERDKVNEQLRSSDGWRNAIKAMGLNPDGPLHLTGQQQKSLAAQLQLPTNDFHIDGAGNINDYHGWKGLPTAAKIAIVGGATVATAGAMGAFSGGAAAGSAASGGAAAGNAGIGLGGTAGFGVITPGMAAAAPTAFGTAATTAGVTAGGGGMLNRLGHLATNRDAIGAVGSMLGASSQASAQNRGTQIDALIAQQKINADQNNDYNTAALRRAELEGTNARGFQDALLARDVEGRASGKDALKSIQHASYIAGGGSEFKPQGGGAALGFGPHAANATEMEGAKGFEAELRKRLVEGNQVPMPTAPGALPDIGARPTPFTIDPSLTQGGTWEKLSGAAGAGLSTWDLLNRVRNRGTNAV